MPGVLSGRYPQGPVVLSALSKRSRGEPPCTLRRVLAWVDPHYGPITKLWCQRLFPPEPRWWVYGCHLARCPVGTRYSPVDYGTAGSSIKRDEALRRALGEAVERYCALNSFRSTSTVVLPARQTPLASRFPACADYEPVPEPFRGLLSEDPITHVPVYRLADDARIHVPAGYVHLGFSPSPPEAPVTLPISTGLAFDSDLCAALWKGLCEVAERDAMMLTWWTRKPCRRIMPHDQDCPESLMTRLERIEQAGLRCYLFDIATDFRVPTVFCIVAGNHYPYWVVGASCQADAISACTKAVDECISIRLSLLSGRWNKDIGPCTSFEWVHGLEDHMLLYGAWKDTDAFDFLIHDGEPPLALGTFVGDDWWTAPKDLPELKQRAIKLDELGLSVLWVDQTQPEARELGSVVKVVVPEMIPMSQHHGARWLGTTRLLHAVQPDANGASSFNPLPHPFA